MTSSRSLGTPIMMVLFDDVEFFFYKRTDWGNDKHHMRMLLLDTGCKGPPLIPEDKLRQLLELCTTRDPFKHIDGTLYRQVDGVAMGSGLGVTFANFYMAHLENTVISASHVKPKLYAR